MIGHSLRCAVCALSAVGFAFAAKAEQAPAEVVDPSLRTVTLAGAAEVLDPDKDAHAAKNPNQPRVVLAADGEARPGCWFMIDGSASKDPLQYPLVFQWRQTAGPAIALSPQDAANPRLWLFLVQPGDYRFELKALNPNGLSGVKDVKFSVAAGRPVLSESEGRKVAGFGEQVALPGEGWLQVAGPPIELTADDEGYNFRPARAGLYIFQAPRAGEIPERRGVYVPPGKTAPFGDRRPLCYLPKNAVGKAHKPLILDGSLSRHPDGPEETKLLKATWITLDKHRGVEIEELPGLRARFKAPREGVYEVKLAVSDGRLASKPESIFIKIDPDDGEEGTDVAVPQFEDAPDLYRDDIRMTQDHVKLGLWEGNLDRAVQLFPSRCGAALRVDPELALPDKFEQIPLALEVMDGPLMHLIDWIARQTDSYYRRERNDAFWLTRNLGWMKDEPIKPVVAQADALCQKPDGSDLMQVLKPWAQRMIDVKAECSLSYERDSQSLVGMLPVSAGGRLKEICGALRLPSGNGLPPPEIPTAMEWRLRKLLGDKKITIKETHARIDLLLRRMSRESGLAVGMDPRQFPKGLPRVDLDVSDAPLRDVIRTVVELAGFDGCSVEIPAGLWFYKGERPYPARELLWDQASVQAYDLAPLLAQIAPISGEIVAHEIQCRIYPGTWSDPGALVFFHKPTQKLLVMHGPAAHRKILEFLNDLGERGEWALGPVEEAVPASGSGQ